VDQALVGVGRRNRIPGWGSVLPLDGPPKRRVQKSGASPCPHTKFKIGAVVTLKPAISRNVPGGTYQVTKSGPPP
jgi:hypothetical protein